MAALSNRDAFGRFEIGDRHAEGLVVTSATCPGATFR
jgi:hypothetical protein